MIKFSPVSRLFVKLLLGFWLCSSILIGLFALLPLIEQNHDRSQLSPEFEQILADVAKRFKQSPRPFSPESIKQLTKGKHHEYGQVRFYLMNDQGRILNSRRPSRPLRFFVLMTEDVGHPISHQFRDQLMFGPYKFNYQHKTFTLYGRFTNHHPRPWFLFFADHKLLSAGLAILLSGLLCGFLAWYLGKPLRTLKHSANALAAGDLSSRVDSKTTGRNDEMGELAIAFNAMADAIENMINNQQRLMGDISHELRTPLTRLQLSLALARKKHSQVNEFDRISYEAEQIDELIGELLSLSRITLNASTTMMDIELAETLSQVLDDAEFEAEQQQKQLNITIPETLRVAHQPKALARAIENLLRNAIRYAASNININAIENQNEIVITVTDDGPGIDDKELEAIFAPFYRPDSARDRESGGWGLGLAITQAAVQAHKGHISAANVSPHGLCVTLTLPRTNPT
ncbi:ATP-binding protein [Shewanella intestini]|uniref:histidine kinase n=1 Tax=Shewanella intestini TaxID=2017544 RepID=A0ABS5I3W1_9GAMM|nr:MULTISPECIES: ATP-binding protein [Shewanella]MBR9728722.1 HAMP domain-containing protein [Shewanella intestini]MRG36798.1 HAMP domain-containing protein [Shewanella sp. XMDDZSB0408]